MSGEPRGFIIRDLKGESCPTAVCEMCGEVITNYQNAGVVWDRDEAKVHKVTVLCKANGCLNKPPHTGKAWQEMRDFGLFLMYNLGFNTEQEVRTAWRITKGLP